VRTEREHAVSHVPGTQLQIPHTQVRAVLPRLPAQGPVVVYCRTGQRSALACQALVDAGIDPERVHDLHGGLQGWARDVDPSITVATP